MLATLLPFIVTGSIFLVLDATWLTIMGNAFYRPQLGSMMLEKVALLPAIGFYLIYVVALTALIIRPALAEGLPTRALLTGLLFGLASYATYDLSNAATLRGWPPLVTFVDLAWGTVATGFTAWLATLVLIAMKVR